MESGFTTSQNERKYELVKPDSGEEKGVRSQGEEKGVRSQHLTYQFYMSNVET